MKVPLGYEIIYWGESISFLKRVKSCKRGMEDRSVQKGGGQGCGEQDGCCGSEAPRTCTSLWKVALVTPCSSWVTSDESPPLMIQFLHFSVTWGQSVSQDGTFFLSSHHILCASTVTATAAIS